MNIHIVGKVWNKNEWIADNWYLERLNWKRIVEKKKSACTCHRLRCLAIMANNIIVTNALIDSNVPNIFGNRSTKVLVWIKYPLFHLIGYPYIIIVRFPYIALYYFILRYFLYLLSYLLRRHLWGKISHLSYLEYIWFLIPNFNATETQSITSQPNWLHLNTTLFFWRVKFPLM